MVYMFLPFVGGTVTAAGVYVITRTFNVSTHVNPTSCIMKVAQ